MSTRSVRLILGMSTLCILKAETVVNPIRALNFGYRYVNFVGETAGEIDLRRSLVVLKTRFSGYYFKAFSDPVSFML